MNMQGRLGPRNTRKTRKPDGRRTGRALPCVRRVPWLLFLVLAAVPARAVEPVNPELIPEARAVLDYLAAGYGKQTLSGIAGWKAMESIRATAGRDPAIVSFELGTWSGGAAWSTNYLNGIQISVDGAKEWWKLGGIVAMQCHWHNPTNHDAHGSAWIKAPRGSGPFDLAQALAAGTVEHEAVMSDLRRFADCLEPLSKARVPVLWRPLHEIDGGWFWWTDGKHPERTAALWRLEFDYLVKERKLNNLIWVYSAAQRVAGGPEQIELRRQFYPGSNYVDLAGIDIYPSKTSGWLSYREDTYARAYDIIRQVAPGKMLALAECSGIPDPDRLKKEGPHWLYCMPWWGEGPHHPAEWIRKTYTNEFVVTRDRLPAWKIGSGAGAK